LNLALLALVATLALLVARKHNVKPEPAAPPLTTLSADAITRVRIQYPGAAPIELQRQNASWWLMTPLRARANTFKVNSLLALAGASPDLRLPADTAQLTKFGLDKPVAQLWLNDAQIDIGDRHPFKSARYVRYQNTIALMPGQVFTPSAYRVTGLISPRLLADTYTLVAIELPHFSLRQQQGKWQITPPRPDLTADQINAFVDEWQLAQAFAVDRYSGKPVTDHIRLTLHPKSAGPESGDEHLDLGIVSQAPEFVLYRSDEGLEYRFTEETGKRLLEITDGPKNPK
jgi:hypothetical protein